VTTAIAQEIDPQGDGAPTAAINLSRDLVRLGVASANLRPDSPTTDARPLFQAALACVKDH
jgi:hypothetical protein